MRKRISVFVTCSKSPKRVLNGSSMVPQWFLNAPYRKFAIKYIINRTAYTKSGLASAFVS